MAIPDHIYEFSSLISFQEESEQGKAREAVNKSWMDAAFCVLLQIREKTGAKTGLITPNEYLFRIFFFFLMLTETEGEIKEAEAALRSSPARPPQQSHVSNLSVTISRKQTRDASLVASPVIHLSLSIIVMSSRKRFYFALFGGIPSLSVGPNST